MPNGGIHHCGHCPHFRDDASLCALRNIPITRSYWTTCRNFNGRHAEEVTGPVLAIVCQVINGAGSYADIPYFDGVRVDTVQRPDGGNTVVCFTEGDGTYHEFPTIKDYMVFYEASGRKM
jgi:hypothetical protein